MALNFSVETLDFIINNFTVYPTDYFTFEVGADIPTGVHRGNVVKHNAILAPTDFRVFRHSPITHHEIQEALLANVPV